MAISVNDSLVVDFTGGTSASFTPSANRLLVIAMIGNSNSGGLSFSPSDTLGSTLTQRIISADNGKGRAAIYTMLTGGSPSARTLSTGVSGGNGFSWCKIYEVDGYDTSTPIGNSSQNGSNASNAPTQGVTAAAAGRLFGVGIDWNELGLPTSPDVEVAGVTAGECDYLAAYKSADHAAAATVDITFDGFGAGGAVWSLVALEIRALVGGPTVTVPPADAHKAIGDTATFSVTATASGGGTLSYQWKVGGVNVSTGSGGTTASYTTDALTLADDAASYTCVVTETGGSSDGTATAGPATLRIGVLLVASSTAVYTGTGTPTTIAPAWPTTAIAAGDTGKVVLVIGMKPATSGAGSVTTPTSPSTWTSVGNIQAAGGYTVGGASSADQGNCDLYVYSIDDPGTVSGTITVTINVGATNGVAWAAMHRYSAPPGSTFSLALATGSDTAAGSVSITFSTDPGVTTGDRILGAMCIPTDVTTPAQFSAQAFTQTGVTFGTVTELQEPDTGNNFDIGGFLVDALATAGPSSAAPVLTATAGGTTTNVRGPGIFLRIRAAATQSTSDFLTFQTVQIARNTLLRM